MQGIRTRHGHLDLRSKNGKTSWNAIEFALLAFNFFLWKCVTFKSDIPNGRLYPTKTKRFFDAWFPTGEEHIPVETDPRPDSNISTNSCNYNKPVCDSWGYMNMK